MPSFTCPLCAAQITIAPTALGREIACPACAKPIQAPVALVSEPAKPEQSPWQALSRVAWLAMLAFGCFVAWKWVSLLRWFGTDWNR